MIRTASSSVAPKSEYLRHALQARRAHNTPTPSPLDMRPPPPSTPKPSEINTKTSPDIFAEFALTEEQTTPVSPIRRRRPSDTGPPRSKTNRELTNEIEKLKDSLMTCNMRVELLKKNNSELQHDLTKAKERVEELEPVEQHNYELQVENDHLRLKVDDMEEECGILRDANDALRKTNEELAAIADESASHWQGQEYAIEEAAECIIKLEEEKSILSAEFHKLKERVTALEDTSHPTILVGDSPGRYPVRVYSVDESRPSTSHFDSDYYSQPASPQVQPSRESIISMTPSERSKKFLDLSEERRRSARDLVKRISAASLKALNIRSSSPPPDVPEIPAAYQQQDNGIEEERMKGATPTPKTPGRYRKGRQAIPQSLLHVAQVSPARSESFVLKSPSAQSEGLRALYRPDRPTRRKTSTDTPSSSTHVSPISATSFTSRQLAVADASPCIPSHSSSKHTHTSSSSEQLQGRSSRHRRQSESDMNSSNGSPQTVNEFVSSEWASLAPPSASVVRESDLTSEVDPREDKDRWWRSMDRLTLSQVMAQSRIVTPQATQAQSQIIQDVRFPPERSDETSTTTRSLRSGERKSKTTPSTPSEYVGKERDFFFNSTEDEETFMQKAKARMGVGSRRQP